MTIGAVLVASTTSHATATAEQRCQRGRHAAAAKYANCQKTAAAILVGRAAFPPVYGVPREWQRFLDATRKCTRKYTAVWMKLQADANGTGATCDAPRFIDNGDGTIIDRLTALQWEKKQNRDDAETPDDPHDADNVLPWTSGGQSGTAADGPAFTRLLRTLNGDCFAGHCDWRLPTVLELQTIGIPDCLFSPCIDPIFGATINDRYWTATTIVGEPLWAWTVWFGAESGISYDPKDGDGYARAVRGGL